MTISPGQAWGRPITRPGAVTAAAGDAELARLAAGARDRGEDLVATVGPGDVLRTLGLDGPRPGSQQLGYRFDLGLATLDGAEPQPFVAHLCAHRPRWAGPFAVVMNCAWMGEWYLGPRAHPNDGLLDVTHGALPPAQRLAARRRAATGSHLPHPALHTARRPRWEHRFERATEVFLDGRPHGRHRQVEVHLIPDCFWLLA
jgi:hypothetical protein